MTIGQLLNDTWSLVSQNLWPVVILGLVLVGMMIVIQGISMGTNGIAAVAMQANEVVGGMMYVVAFVIQQVLSVALAVIPVRYTLNLARGVSDQFQGVFNFSGPEILRCIGVQFVIILISMAIAFVVMIPVGILMGLMFAMQQNGGDGIAALIAIPVGIVVVVAMLFLVSRVSLSFFFLLDRKQGVMEAINSSWQFTKGNALAFLVALFVGGLLSGLVTILTCLVGGIVAWPAFQLIYAVTYFRVTGQPMAIDGRTA